ncbi:hypothetical protein DL762_003670 [Monosporascus cannonballus]|uniref:SHSP domain-containing protein n=1 Tax=Monosporascus cannonballus TaxID=155416 RepID=A0ABY0HCW8_9PEZI|nr:hypothetical protein DL762_003670 [Monosporascus cannonballus]
MSLFASPRYYSPAAEPNFSGLFRLIDDWDRHVQQQTSGIVAQRGAGRHLPLITPKFDLKETDTAYELHGELPGIEKDRVSIEFSDDQTIVIRGSVERSHTSSSGTTAEGNENGNVNVGAGDNADKQAHKPTVEDAPEGDSGNKNKSVEKSGSGEVQQQQSAPKYKYWVSERSFGEFQRSFSFPSRIDTEGVTASLNNGVLTIVVPKAKKHEARRVTIN